MKKPHIWYLIVIGTLLLVLSACLPSNPETPQAVSSLAGTSWELEPWADRTIPSQLFREPD
jgi:hypothetical protein